MDPIMLDEIGARIDMVKIVAESANTIAKTAAEQAKLAAQEAKNAVSLLNLTTLKPYPNVVVPLNAATYKAKQTDVWETLFELNNVILSYSDLAYAHIQFTFKHSTEYGSYYDPDYRIIVNDDIIFQRIKYAPGALAYNLYIPYVKIFKNIRVQCKRKVAGQTLSLTVDGASCTCISFTESEILA